MRVESPALRLTVFLTDTGCYHHRPLGNEIVRRARKAGLAGATVFHGVEGFGASSCIHSAQVMRLRDERPVRIVIVDEAGRIRAFLPELDEARRPRDGRPGAGRSDPFCGPRAGGGAAPASRRPADGSGQPSRRVSPAATDEAIEGEAWNRSSF